MLFPITTGRYALLLLMMQAAYCQEERGYETEVIGVDCSFQHNHHGNLELQCAIYSPPGLCF